MKHLHSFLAFALFLGFAGIASGAEPVHMANGIKIGEVTADSAIIWTRLTAQPERNRDGEPWSKDAKTENFEDISGMENSVPGTAGEVRVTWWPAESAGEGDRQQSEWQAVDPEGDFIRQIPLEDLQPGTRYALLVEGRAPDAEEPAVRVEGSFVTAPAAEEAAPVRFAVVTGQEFGRRDDPDNGHRIYPSMQELDLHFFVHTGDTEYYDKPEPFATDVKGARYRWNRIYAMPLQRAFHNQTASYFIKDDHDTLKNDCWPGQTYGELTWEEGLRLFREQVPMGEKTWRTVRWGKDLQIWLVEGRDFRSPNTMPDGPEKTIWGEEQKQWVFESMKASDATWRILISPTPIVGPDRGGKNDNHANKGFSHEGNEIREFLSGLGENTLVICGDRHWQYVSEDPETGVREYSCGPTTDKHAGGFSKNDESPMHKYLNIKGGFLSVSVEREDGEPRAIFRHHAPDGSVYNEDVRVLD